MADIPKVVSARLGGGASIDTSLAATHPDAESLGAFAEQALSAEDREKMLGHLSLCADCREVLALAMPPETVAVPLSRQVSLQAPFRVPLDAEFREYVRSEHRLEEDQRFKEDRSRAAPPTHDESDVSGAPAGKNWWPGLARPNLGWAALAAGVAVAASMLMLHPLQERQAANSAAGQVVVTEQIPAAADSRLAAEATEPAESKAVAGMKSKAASSDGPTKKSFEATLEARNVAPIQKAKPALRSQETLNSGNQPASALNPQSPLRWEVVDGVLRRSSDGGENWDSVLRADHPLQCYASHDRDVWAGGQAGTLFHSEDAGKTWVKLNINTPGEVSPSDIAHIDVRWNGSSAVNEIVVSNKAMDKWSSTDGGVNWRKK